MADKITRAHRWRFGRSLPLVGIVIGLAACSSPQPRLYLLNAGPVQQGQRAALAAASDRARQDVSAPLFGIKAGLSVTIPEYLDRPDILVRSNGNELTPLPKSRWAEDLSITTSRVMAADLAAALPGADIVAWPTRVARAINFRIAVDLTKFESDAFGTVEIEGRWTLLELRAPTRRAPAAASGTRKSSRTSTRRPWFKR